jgi:hypothetical protein
MGMGRTGGGRITTNKVNSGKQQQYSYRVVAAESGDEGGRSTPPAADVECQLTFFFFFQLEDVSLDSIGLDGR